MPRVEGETMMESEIRPLAAGIVFVAGLIAVGVALYAWWPFGMALGVLLGVVVTAVLGRRLQRQAAAAPADDELLEQLRGVSQQSTGGVTRSVYEPRTPSRRPASVR